MKHKKYIVILIFLFMFIFSTTVYAAIEYVCLNLNYDGANHQYVNQKVSLYINGKEMKNLTMPPVIFDNFTLVPAREVFEEVGAKVQWDANTYKVTINYNDKNVILKIGDKNAMVNNTSTSMSIPAKIINNKTMIPLRFVSSSVGLNVLWDSKTRTASVNEILSNINSVNLPKTSEEGKFVINLDKEANGINHMILTENGRRLVVDVNKCGIKTVSNNMDVSNFAVSKVRLGENDKTARVVFDLKGDFQYNVQLSEDKKSIEVNFVNNSNETSETETEAVTDSPIWSGGNNAATEQTTESYQNILNSDSGDISYDVYSTSLSIKKNGGTFNLNNVEHIDDYNNGIYKVVFYGDYRNFVRNSSIGVNDHNFSEIQVSVTEEALKVTFNEKSVLAFNVLEDEENIYINALHPKAKYKNIVVLDAGHGGHDTGAMSQGYVEKSITLDIVNRVMALLENDPNIKGYATRTTDFYPSFEDRNNLGNTVGDLFVSVHINSASSEKANGTEVFYYNMDDVSSSRGISSSLLAGTLLENLLEKLESFDRKVKRENFIVLRQSTVPATLCEIGFITNVEEGAKLNSPEYRQLAAEAIYESFKELFEKYPNR